MRRLALLLLALAGLAACQPDDYGRSASELRQEEQQCKADGGRWASGGLSPAKLCFLPTSDGGEACSRASDCESICRVDTVTEEGFCAAERPNFGCIDMFDDTGERVTICVD